MSLTVTELAQAKLQGLLEEERAKSGNAALTLRIYVQGRCGCGAVHFGMSLEDRAFQDDALVSAGDVKVLVDPEAVEPLAGAELDYIDEALRQGFTLHNLPANAGCACGGR